MAVIQSVLNNRISYSRKLTGNDERSEVAFVFWSQVDEILKDQLKIAAKSMIAQFFNNRLYYWHLARSSDTCRM